MFCVRQCVWWHSAFLIRRLLDRLVIMRVGGTCLLIFNIGLAIILIPGGFEVETSYPTAIDFYAAFALYVSEDDNAPAR